MSYEVPSNRNLKVTGSRSKLWPCKKASNVPSGKPAASGSLKYPFCPSQASTSKPKPRAHLPASAISTFQSGLYILMVRGLAKVAAAVVDPGGHCPSPCCREVSELLLQCVWLQKRSVDFILSWTWKGWMFFPCLEVPNGINQVSCCLPSLGRSPGFHGHTECLLTHPNIYTASAYSLQWFSSVSSLSLCVWLFFGSLCLLGSAFTLRTSTSWEIVENPLFHAPSAKILVDNV